MLNTLLKLEQAGIDSKVPMFVESLLDFVMRKVTQPDALEAVLGEDGHLHELKLRGWIKMALLRELSIYAGYGAPGDLDSVEDLKLTIKQLGNGGESIQLEPSAYLKAVLTSVGRAALTQSFLNHRNRLTAMAEEETEAKRGGAKTVVERVTYRYVVCKLPKGYEPGQTLTPLSEYILRMVTHAVTRQAGNMPDAGQEETVRKLMTEGFCAFFLPTLQVALFETLQGRGLLPFRVSEGNEYLYSSLVYSGAYAALVRGHEVESDSNGTKPDSYNPKAGYDFYLALMPDVGACLGLTAEELMASPNQAGSGNGETLLFAKCWTMRYAFRPGDKPICSSD